MGILIVLGIITFIIIRLAIRSEEISSQNQQIITEDTYKLNLDNISYNKKRASTNTDTSVQELHFDHIHRKGNRPNNMNCDQYIFNGIFTQTQKRRTNKIAYVFPNETPLEVIKRLGYEEPIEYEYKEWEEMSDKQRSVLSDRYNGKYQSNLSSIDASGLISRVLDDAESPSVELFEYVDSIRIPTSYYQTVDRLLNCIFDESEDKECIAFYIYVVYCRKLRKKLGNLQKSQYSHIFYNFALQMLNEYGYEYRQDISQRLDHCLNSSNPKWKQAKQYLIENGALAK